MGTQTLLDYFSENGHCVPGRIAGPWLWAGQVTVDLFLASSPLCI